MNNNVQALVPALCLLLLPMISMAADSVPVYVTQAFHGQVTEKLPLTGTITSERDAAISSRVSGLVGSIYVDAGDVVEKGDILIEQDPTLARLALNRSLAALNESRAELKESIRLRDEARNLRKSNSIPETTVHAREADVDMKRAAVARLEAEYRQQEEVVERHTLYAPFSGVVSRKLTEVGEWVETGTPVVELVAIDQLRLDVRAPQEYFSRINGDTPVKVRLDTAENLEFDGRIIARVPVNNPNARTFLVRVHINDAEKYIIPGMSAQAVFDVNLEREALTLPRDAIVKHPDGRNTVWIVRDVEGKLIASELQVKLGKTLTESIIVRHGLAPGSTVVVRGNETLQDGQAVHILNPNNAAMN